MILVSGAGAATNLIIAFLSLILLYRVGVQNIFLNAVLSMLVIYNVYFAVFNLLPVPPLDGSKILFALMPTALERTLYRYESYFNIILIILLVSGIAGRVVFPLAQGIIGWMLGVIL